MHLAFVSQIDARDVRSWSGIPHHMVSALRQHVDRLSLVTPLPEPGRLRSRVQKARHFVRGKAFRHEHTEPVARGYAQAAAAQLRQLRPDAILSPSSLPVAYLETEAPVGFWTDATFESNLLFYPEYSALTSENVLSGHRIEQAALDRAAAFYASAYAARSAVDYYGASPDRVHVVPFGANLEKEPSAEEVEAAIESRPLDRCQLLFLGVTWERKGGDVAVRVADALNASGLPTELIVAGTPPVLERPRPYVRAAGFLDKRTAAGRDALSRLLASSHFLILPGRVEAFGCVFSEASAYGVPSLGTAVGGVPTAVEDGVNGIVFPARPSPVAIAERIRELLGHPERYRALARSSRARYERELNWTAAARVVVEHLAAR